jgi:ParB-like chromosome segregation protein Spo0J
MTISQPNTPFMDALAALRAELEKPDATPPEEHPRYLERRQIARLVSVFQPRTLEGRLAEDEIHLKELEDAIGDPEKPKLLDAITVWWGGDRYYVIDGHHRLIAYERKGLEGGIPVEVFDGTLDEAMARSAALNSKNRLPMRPEDKRNHAWKLVLFSSLSKREIVEACAVSNGTVGHMRNVKAKLLLNPEKTLQDLYEMTWTQARLNAAGKLTDTPVDPDAALKKRAERYAKSLVRAVKDRPFVDPEGFALAMRMLDERLPGMLMQTEVWGDAFRETVDGFRDELASAEELAAHWDAEGDY